MPQKYSRSAYGFTIFAAAVTWLALGLQLYIMLKNAPANGLTRLSATGNFLSFFTIWTNFLVAITLVSLLFAPSSRLGRFLSRPSTLAAITVYIFIVGLTYNVLLRFTWAPTGLQRWVDEALHVICPLLFIIFWITIAPITRLPWSKPLLWLLYPAVYLVFALLRGEYSNFHAYPFINTAELGYGRVLLNSGFLMVVFIITGFLVVAISRKMAARSHRPATF